MGEFTTPTRLAPEHELDRFDCGSSSETDWLRRFARLAEAEDTGRVYVTTLRESRRVVGYYSLATGAVAQMDAPRSVTRRAGGYPISVVILTRLGVDRRVQGRGIGRSLVRDAMLRVEQAADIIGVRALLIHAGSAQAKDFYEGLAEFEESPTDRLHLMLTLQDLRAALRP